MNGLMTEREWRKRAAHRRQRPDYWGAQCVLPRMRRPSLKQDRAFHAFLLFLSLVIALLLPILCPSEKPTDYPEWVARTENGGVQVREVSAVTYALPADIPLQSVTYRREALLRGKLLLLDEAHPLPDGTPAPNTHSIAEYGKGMVPVRNLSVRSGRETIGALQELFATLGMRGVSGLCVWQGTMSAAEQREARLLAMRTRAAHMPLNAACRAALAVTDTPRTGDLQQEYTVELRFAGRAGCADGRPLDATTQGQKLLHFAWRSGFIRREATGTRAYRFRYVGKAHAAAMTYLDLPLERYLEWLHKQGTLVVSQDGAPRYIILCKPMNGSHIEFGLPQGAVCEASLDNTGYAVVACTLTAP